MKRLREIIGDEVVGGAGDLEVTGLEWDSRLVKPGVVFFALPGTKTNGTRFAREAVQRGAVAVVSEQALEGVGAPVVVVASARKALASAAAMFFQNPSKDLKVVGVTGTNGKTTTTFLTKHILDTVGRKSGLIGTVQYSLGERTLPALHTTPEAPQVMELMARMLGEGCRCCVMEVSSHALAQHRVDGVEFDVGVFTNLTQDHLDYHGTMEGYFGAKRRLFELMEGQEGKRGKMLVNADDRWGHRLVDEFGKRGRVWTYGFAVTADYRARDMKTEVTGTTFTLSAKGREYLVRLPLIGQFNVYNALAAVGAANLLGVEVRAAVEALGRVPQIPGRLERVAAKRAFQVYVDYAHTPDALENVLRTLRELRPRRVLTVFGCGGNRDRGKRAKMAAVAEEYSDWVILTSDNPRDEEPEAIMAEAAEGFSRENHELIVERGAAIRRAVELAGPGDVVLIAGKGHETYQEVRGVRYPFDDVQQAARAISEKPSLAE